MPRTIRVRHDTKANDLIQHMANTLHNEREFIASASNGEASNTMNWAIACLDGFFEGYAVSHSKVIRAAGHRGDVISIVEVHVWLQEEDLRNGRKAEENSDKAEPDESN